MNPFDAAALMQPFDVGVIPVVDDGGFLGIVTDRDLVLRVLGARKRRHETALWVTSSRVTQWP